MLYEQGPEGPLKAAKLEIESARSAIRRMEAAADSTEYRSAWNEFLGAIEKCWNKTERALKDDTKFQPWQGQYENRRKNESMLLYLKHARNVDQHTLEESTLPLASSTAVAIRPKSGRTSAGEILKSIRLGPNGASSVDENVELKQLNFPPRMLLRPVIDRGATYPVPTEYKGTVLHSDPLVVARLALEFYEDFVGKAEQKFVVVKTQESTSS